MLTLSSLDLMPPPFAWIDIPAGKVTLEAGGYVPEGGQTFDVPAFTIAKYPVTNAQFAKFIEAGGYQQKRWWSNTGWQTREESKALELVRMGGEFTPDPWTEPHFWQNRRLNNKQYPVVGVSWYEASAFCAWLSEMTGEKISLPTEQQWQRAAQGDDGRIYPWGNEWDASRCNNPVYKHRYTRGTTPVIEFEGRGDSPYGVVDMAGNVEEWCLTDFTTGSTDTGGTEYPELRLMILRGGSWSLGDAHHCNVTLRGGDFHVIREYEHVGFRLARHP